MTNQIKFFVSATLQVLLVALHYIHIHIQHIGSDNMFYAFLLTVLNAAFLFYLSFKKDGLQGTTKIIALILGACPIVVVLIFIMQFL